jgi:hypothetical protein
VIFFGVGRLFPVEGKPPMKAKELIGALATGLLAGLGARGFSAVLRPAKHIATRVAPWKRISGYGLGLVLTAAVTFAVYDAPLSLGPGYGAIDWTRAATRSLGLILLLLVVRAVATTCTLAAGGAGGVFIPLFVEGWILGAAVEAVVHSNTMLFPVIGAAAFLGAGYRTPIATAGAQLVMGSRSVTRSRLVRRRNPVELRGAGPVVDGAPRRRPSSPPPRSSRSTAEAGAHQAPVRSRPSAAAPVAAATLPIAYATAMRGWPSSARRTVS